MLDGTVAEAEVTGAVVGILGVTGAGGVSSGGVVSSEAGIDTTAREGSRIDTGAHAAAGGVGDVTVTREDHLGEGFLGIEADDIADGFVAWGGAAGADHLHPVTRVDAGVDVVIARADHDFGRAQLVGHHDQVHVVEGRYVAGARGAIFGGATLVGGDGHRHLVLVVRREDTEGQADLLEVIHAGDTLGLGFGFGQCRQEHTRQDGNDRDHDEQLDQRERPRLGPFKESFHATCWVVGLTVRAL
ncbi:MAG: hypothetical protein RI897_4005 [Verrucomicrobiota bacterium]